MSFKRAAFVVLALGCVVLSCLIVAEVLGSGAKKDAAPAVDSPGSYLVTSVVSTLPATPLCDALVKAQQVALSRGGSSEDEIFAGMAEIMAEYLNALNVVLGESEAAALPELELSYLRSSISNGRDLFELAETPSSGSFKEKVLVSGLSVSAMAKGAPTLYAVSSNACRVELGLRVQ